MVQEYLLTRASDLAVLGVRLHGFEVESTDTGPVAVAVDPDPVVSLVVPPQHLQEQTLPGPSTGSTVVAGNLAGPSRLSFSVSPGVRIPLDPHSVLSACAWLRPGSADPTATWIEMPWALALAPREGNAIVPSNALTSPGGAVGLWLTRLVPPDYFWGAGRPEPALRIRPLDRNLAGRPDAVADPSLSAGQRVLVSDLSTEVAPALATRWQLTPLGGDLAAHGEWDGVAWSHRVAGGRDQYVRVEERVQLYPFGFTASLITLTQRDPAPDAPAFLARQVTLRLHETVRTSPDGHALSRTFPFERVEVTNASFSNLGGAQPSYVYKRATPDTQESIDRRDALRADAEAQHDIWGPYVDNQHVDVDDLRRRGDGRVTEYDAALAAAQTSGPAAADAETSYGLWSGHIDKASEYEQQAADLRQIGPDGTVSDEAEAQAREYDGLAAGERQEAAQYYVDPSYLHNIRAQAAADESRYQAAYAVITAVTQQEWRTPQDAINLGDENPAVSGAAATGLQEAAEADGLDAWINAVQAAEASVTATSWPADRDHAHLMFPVRLSRGRQVVHVMMPMLMVHDVSLEALPDLDLPAYRTLDDPALATEIDKAWAGPPEDVPSYDDLSGRNATFDATATPASVVHAGGALLDVVGASVPKPSDSQVLRTLNLLGGSTPGALFEPTLGRLATTAAEVAAGATAQVGRWGMAVDLPELRTLAGSAAAAGAVSPGAVVSFARQYVDQGAAADVLLNAVGPIGVDLTGAAERSGGLAALQLASDVISRDHGPVQLASLLADPDPKDLIGDAATLLGFKLQDLLHLLPDVHTDPPKIVSDLVDGKTPTVTMSWTNVPLQDLLAFKTHQVPDGTPPGDPSRTHLDLTVLARVDGVVTDCSVNAFALQFPFADNDALVRLEINKLHFHQQTTYGVSVVPGVGLGSTPSVDVDVSGHVSTTPPKLDLDLGDITFLGPLKLLEELQNAVDLLGNVAQVHAGPSGVTASYTVPVPDVSCGVFALSNLGFHSSIDVPFDARPVTVGIGFASRDKPFSLSVLSFAGGGYIDVQIDAHGPRVEASLEFGAQLSVDFVVAKGEVHAFGGVQYLQEGALVRIAGYLRIGGSLEVLALVSVSVELRISLAYDSDTSRLVGRATLVLEIDLTLWSDKIEIDSGEWVLQGGTAPAASPQSADDPPSSLLEDVGAAFAALDEPVTDEELAAWRSYRSSVAGAGAPA